MCLKLKINVRKDNIFKKKYLFKENLTTYYNKFKHKKKTILSKILSFQYYIFKKLDISNNDLCNTCEKILTTHKLL